jgi:hypothetical protein
LARIDDRYFNQDDPAGLLLADAFIASNPDPPGK